MNVAFYLHLQEHIGNLYTVLMSAVPDPATALAEARAMSPERSIRSREGRERVLWSREGMDRTSPTREGLNIRQADKGASFELRSSPEGRSKGQISSIKDVQVSVRDARTVHMSWKQVQLEITR
jgi:hypothetical protein